MFEFIKDLLEIIGPKDISPKTTMRTQKPWIKTCVDNEQYLLRAILNQDAADIIFPCSIDFYNDLYDQKLIHFALYSKKDNQSYRIECQYSYKLISDPNKRGVKR